MDKQQDTVRPSNMKKQFLNLHTFQEMRFPHVSYGNNSAHCRRRPGHASRSQESFGRITRVKVIGEADNGLEAIRMSREMAPRVVFLDIAMPEKDGLL